jgi:two-component system, OmpR family, phosphate regulon sensor histidine kinase PhoR
VKLGIRGRLFVVSLLLVAAAYLAVGLYLESQLRVSLERRIEAELGRHAETAAELLAAQKPDLDRVADRLGQSTRARVTIVAPDGRVLGDSAVEGTELRDLDPHHDRPEVAAALQGGRGVARRYSRTLGTDMLYVATRVDQGNVVRVAVPLSEVDERVFQLRVLLAVSGLLGLAIAGFMMAVAYRFLSRALQSLVHTAHEVASGQPTRLPEASQDELAGLAGSFNRMAEELERTMAVLASERNRFETVLETMDQAVVGLDPEQRITTINRTARALLKLSDDVVGRPLLEAVRIPQLKQLVDEPALRASAAAVAQPPDARGG